MQRNTDSTRHAAARPRRHGSLLRGALLLPLVAAALLPFLLAACEDRLPATGPAPPSADSSDNMFVLDGDGYSGEVFSFSKHSARAYYFPDDATTSILNAEVVTTSSGKRVQTVVHLNVPGMTSGTYAWQNAVVDPTATTKARISIDGVEYVSVSGSTQVFFVLDPVSRKLLGAYQGVLESAAGKQVRVTRGRFDGGFF